MSARCRLFFGFLCLALTGCAARHASSETKESVALSSTLAESGIPIAKLIQVAPDSWGRQRKENWCWAASTQMVLNYYGINISQEQVVSRIFGDLRDQPGTQEQILAALSGWDLSTLNGGRPVVVQAVSGLLSDAQIVAELHNERPLIVGLRNPNPGAVGHAYVLTSVSWSAQSAIIGGQAVSTPRIESVTLRDPWPDNQSKLVLSAEEFRQRFLMLFQIHATAL